MSKPYTFTATLFPLGPIFGTDFYIVAQIAVDHFGSPEVGRGYMADPANYDPGSGPEWFVEGNPELFHDCGNGGEKVEIGQTLADALDEFICDDPHMIEQVESNIAAVAMMRKRAAGE